jgi:hypothetical protein
MTLPKIAGTLPSLAAIRGLSDWAASAHMPRAHGVPPWGFGLGGMKRPPGGETRRPARGKLFVTC